MNVTLGSKATKSELRQEIAELRHVGQQMSNLCFNLSQKEDNPHRETMAQLYRNWDAIKAPRKDRLIRRLLILALLAVAANAQTQFIPVNGGTVDQISWVTKALDQLQASVGNLFLQNAQSLADKLGLLALVLAGLAFAYGHVFGRWHVSAGVLWNAMWRYLAVRNILIYYNSPIPLVGYSFHQLFTEEGRWLASQIDITLLDRFLQTVNYAFGVMEKPHYWDIPSVVLYFLVLLNMGLVEIALFIVNSFSFWAIGVGIIWGVFAVVGLLFRSTSFLFHSWLHYMIKYSMYRVVAAMVVYVWATVILNFFDSTMHGDYSLGHWAAVLPAFMVLNASAVFTALMVGHISNELLNGAAMAGSTIGGIFGGMISRRF